MVVAAHSTHRDLLAWREAMALVEEICRDTAAFPREEVYGLAAQIRRAAVSVPSNIAEGAGRNSGRELAHYLGITCGSLAELETQVELAVRLKFLRPDAPSVGQTRRVVRLVTRLRDVLRKKLA